MQDESQRKESIKQVFDTVAAAYGRGACRFFHDSGETLAQLLPLSGHESVLDIASGTGTTALPLAKRLPHGKVTAVDFSSGMLEQARISAQQQGLNNLTFVESDMTALPFEANQFDYATCSFGLFFVDDMSSALKHFASTVKPGGTVTVSGFCGDSFQPMAKRFLDRLRAYGIDAPEKPGWSRMAEPAQLKQIFAEAGLIEVKIERRALGYFIDLDGWWDVIWNAGFRGMVERLGDKKEEFKRAHLDELKPLQNDQGLWLEIEVNFTSGVVRGAGS